MTIGKVTLYEERIAHYNDKSFQTHQQTFKWHGVRQKVTKPASWYIDGGEIK